MSEATPETIIEAARKAWPHAVTISVLPKGGATHWKNSSGLYNFAAYYSLRVRCGKQLIGQTVATADSITALLAKIPPAP